MFTPGPDYNPEVFTAPPDEVEPIENLATYLAQYDNPDIGITIDDVMVDFGMSYEEAILAVNMIVSGEP